MRGTKTLYELGLTVEQCITCGVCYAMPTELETQLRKNHNLFYCPNGHGQHYSEKTRHEQEIHALSQNLKECRIIKEDYQKENKLKSYQARYWKGQVTKMKKEATE